MAVQANGEFCTQDPTLTSRLNKFLFIVDKSRSNTWTDPGAQNRRSNIESFITSSNMDFTRVGLVTFNGTQAHSLVADPSSGLPGFTGDINKLMTATSQLQSIQDDDATPYKAALQEAQLVLKNDLLAHPEEQGDYNVIFVSDGAPTDIQDDSELESLVDQVLNLDKGHIVLSTALYGSETGAAGRLAKMAQKGQGKFINFAEGPWDLTGLVVKPSHEPWQMKSFLVYNLNAAFCLDGAIDLDSDLDGMCDRDELQFGFDPANRFSWSDGYGDYFHWRQIKYGEVLPPCTDQSDVDHDLLTACEEAYIKNDQPTIGIGRSGDPKNPDTDNDGMIDGIETFVFMPRTMAMAMDALNLSRNNYDDEEPAGLQISQHRNPLVQDPHAVKYNPVLVPVDTVAQHDCYQLAQSTLPLYPSLAVKANQTLSGFGHESGENSVLVYYMETPQSNPNGRGVYRFTVQKMKYGVAAQLNLSDSRFQTYVTPPSASAP